VASGNEEMAWVDDRLAQVVRIAGEDVTLQMFAGTEGVATDAEVVFLGKTGHPESFGDDLAGRFFDAYGRPIDGGPDARRARSASHRRPVGESRAPEAAQ
jgi:V/A-type H+-transporting ATPase subunit B